MREAKSLCLISLIAGVIGCSDTPGLPGGPAGFRVTFVGNTDVGSPENPRPFSTDRNTPDELTVRIEALRGGQVDSSFNGWVAITVRPESVSCPKVQLPDPPAVQLQNGVADNVKISIINGYCTVRVVVTDEGFVPGATGEKTACNNGVDDDRDGYIDQQDRGCYRLPGGIQKTFFPSDKTETGGTGISGASPPIYFRCPLIRDIQTPVMGVTADESPLLGCRGVLINEGWLLVTRVGVDGLYVADFDGVKWDPAVNNWSFSPEELGYDCMFVYNYSTPLNLQEGDCLTQIDGSVFEFYGFTELNKPTWKKGDFGFCGVKGHLAGVPECPDKEVAGDCCDAGCVERLKDEERDEQEIQAACCTGSCKTDYACIDYKCRPDPETPKHRKCRERIEQLVNSPLDITRLLIDDKGTQQSVWDQPKMLTEPFESCIVKLSNVEMFTEARACDSNYNNQIDWGIDEEKQCSNSCGDDKSCIVLETYNRYHQWTVHFKDGLDQDREVAIVTAGSIQDFDPIRASNEAGATARPVKEVVGTMRHLVFGRPPWTIETRRPSDCPDCKH